MTDRYENIRKALARVCDPGAHPKRYTQERYTQALTKLRLACDPDTIRELLAEMDALESQVREFRRIGSLLANAAYNLSQHTALKGSTREALDNLRRQWDAAIAAANGGGDE